MTSKKLYLAKWLENCKRRNWTFLLCLVAVLFAQPVMVAVNLTSSFNNLQKQIVQGLDVASIEAWQQELQSSYLRMSCFSEEMVLMATAFAVLFAVQGFSFLYSRRKMDFYMSVPVSAPKRYLMIMGNGVLVFGAVSLVSMVLCICIGAGFGLFGFEVLLQMLLSWFVTMLQFTAVYQVALMAVMLTGNVLTALLGGCVFFFYEPLVRLLTDQLKSSWFTTYCYAESYRFQDLPYLTPVASAFQFVSSLSYQGVKLYGTPYGDEVSSYAAVGIQILIMVLSIALWGGIAYLLFRRRKTEKYNTAIAFLGAKGPIRFMLLAPCGVTAGLLAYLWAGNSQTFLWCGALVGLLLGHVVIQLIYERDLRAVKKRLLSLGCGGAAALLLLAVFYFDLTGYDYYVPDAEDVATVSISVANDYSGVSRLYRVPFDGSRLDMENTLLNEMESADPETIAAVVDMAADYVAHLKADPDGNGTEREGETDLRWWTVRYELKSGREVYRRFYCDSMEMTQQVNTVMRDETYQSIRFQLLDPAFEESLDRMKVVYSNGVQEYLYTMDKETLYQALAAEMKTYDYSLISEHLPTGLLTFTIPSEENPGSNLCLWKLPVYETFENTLALIAGNGIPVWEEHPLQAADIDSVTVEYYYYEEAEDNQIQLFDQPHTEQASLVREQNISVTITRQEEIEKLLDALYPMTLTDVTDNNMHRYDDFASNCGVAIVLSSEGKQKRLDVPGMNLLVDEIPEFLIEKLKDAAVTE